MAIFFLYKKIVKIMSENIKNEKMKEKKIPVGPFFSHPAATQETTFFLRVA